MKKLLFGIFIFTAIPALAQNVFQPLLTQDVQVVQCSFQDGKVRLETEGALYTPYEKLNKVKLIGPCQRVEIANSVFYVIRYDTEVSLREGARRAQITEFVMRKADSSQLQTVRSEVGDVSSDNLHHSLKVDWGQNRINLVPMLNLEVLQQGRSTHSYQLQFDPNSNWFINIF